MSRRIIIRRRADRDLDEQAECIARNNLQAARRFYDVTAQAFEQLAAMPEMGSRRAFRNPALVGPRLWRILGFERHLILYRPIQDGIEVIRVLHSARDIDTRTRASRHSWVETGTGAHKEEEQPWVRDFCHDMGAIDQCVLLSSILHAEAEELP